MSMAVILDERTQLLDLLNCVQSQPETAAKLIVEGTLWFMLYGPTQAEVLVDKWPGATSVLIRPAKHHIEEEFPEQRNFTLIIYSWNYDTLFPFLSTDGVIDWEQFWLLRAVDPDILSIVRRLAVSKRIRFTTSDTDYIFVWQGKQQSGRQINLPEGLSLDKLRPEDVHMVCSTWKYNKGKSTEILTLYLIKTLPCSCIRDARGRCVSWAVTNLDGSIGQIHTLPDYRRRGLAHIVWNDAARKVSDKGFTTYSLVETDNIASLNMFAQSDLCRKVAGNLTFAHLSAEKQS